MGGSVVATLPGTVLSLAVLRTLLGGSGERCSLLSFVGTSQEADGRATQSTSSAPATATEGHRMDT
ncbi:MAG: hypothetical protein QOC66_3793, partial [Pseudonocardiales bacterium]|nr:hypothetical protein [Pseudonocardiales bacterium]